MKTFLFLSSLFLTFNLYSQSSTTIDIKDLHVRDPYIVTDVASNRYILYKSSDTIISGNQRVGGVVAYESNDLKTWKGPIRVFTTPQDNWINGTVWAPEVHQHNGKYYLFATINSDREWKANKVNWPKYTYRAVQIFYSDSPLGPFLPFDNKPTLAKDLMTLDGTLWVEDGIPYMIYCHEWVQIVDGSMDVIQMSNDLSKTVGQSKRLFQASEANWSTGSLHADGNRSYVTDGCFLYRTKTGKLLMIWSSFKDDSYAIGIAESSTGKVLGPWLQQEDLIFEKDGGHGMLFKGLDDKLYIALHGPNNSPGKERALIYPIEDMGDTLKLKHEN